MPEYILVVDSSDTFEFLPPLKHVTRITVMDAGKISDSDKHVVTVTIPEIESYLPEKSLSTTGRCGGVALIDTDPRHPFRPMSRDLIPIPKLQKISVRYDSLSSNTPLVLSDHRYIYISFTAQ
jgi:hypothetical protein